MVINPPYGKRLGEQGQPQLSEWKRWGRALRATRPGWRLAVVSPRRDLADALGTTGSPKLRFRNGGIPVGVYAGDL